MATLEELYTQAKQFGPTINDPRLTPDKYSQLMGGYNPEDPKPLLQKEFLDNIDALKLMYKTGAMVNPQAIQSVMPVANQAIQNSLNTVESEVANRNRLMTNGVAQQTLASINGSNNAQDYAMMSQLLDTIGAKKPDATYLSKNIVSPNDASAAQRQAFNTLVADQHAKDQLAETIRRNDMTNALGWASLEETKKYREGLLAAKGGYKVGANGELIPDIPDMDPKTANEIMNLSFKEAGIDTMEFGPERTKRVMRAAAGWQKAGVPLRQIQARLQVIDPDAYDGFGKMIEQANADRLISEGKSLSGYQGDGQRSGISSIINPQSPTADSTTDSMDDIINMIARGAYNRNQIYDQNAKALEERRLEAQAEARRQLGW